MDNVGFTGTSKGLTNAQHRGLKDLMERLGVLGLHHGDCVGADAAAHQLAKARKAWIVVHPPTEIRKRAWCRGYEEMRNELPYLDRNHQIVIEGEDGLIATPDSKEERVRSGTWATVRFARKMGRTIWFVYPDGTTHTENPTPASILDIPREKV